MTEQMMDRIGTEGVWAVSTKSSTYVVDLGDMTLCRTPAQEGLDGFEVSQLRKDAETVPLLKLSRCVLGESMVALIDVRGDGVATVRQTTPIQQITAVGA